VQRIVYSIIYVIAIVLMVACAIDPKGERPGFGLTGEVHQRPVEDWSFTEDSGEIFIETVTSYWIPHSVTAWCVDCRERTACVRDPSMRRIGKRCFQ